jgi:hypothetical protein
VRVRPAIIASIASSACERHCWMSQRRARPCKRRVVQSLTWPLKPLTLLRLNAYGLFFINIILSVALIPVTVPLRAFAIPPFVLSRLLVQSNSFVQCSEHREPHFLPTVRLNPLQFIPSSVTSASGMYVSDGHPNRGAYAYQ